MNKHTSKTIIKLNKLSADWREVTAKIITQKTFDYELFKKVFVKTFKEAERLSHQKRLKNDTFHFFYLRKILKLLDI